MIVYRRISSNDLNKYLNSEKINGSNIYTILDARSFGIFYNNHWYHYDEKYIHFFKDLVDARDYISHMPSGIESVVLSFDIPEKLLRKFEGRGLYEFNNETVVAKEYAIPEYMFKSNWLRKVIDDRALIDAKRKKVDYSGIGFGFMDNSNEFIDNYINSHVIGNESGDFFHCNDGFYMV